MFVPLRDRNSLKAIHFQRMTVALIAINVIVYFVNLAFGEQEGGHVWSSLGFTPADFFRGTTGPGNDWHVPPVLTLLTHSFLHTDVWHLAGNMLFLWVFGDNVEDALGSWRFLGFYLIGAIIAALCEGLFGANPDLPLIGASGAVSACIGAYFLLYPKSKIWILLFFRIPLLLPAYAVVAIFIATQLLFVVFHLDGGTAWYAHLGGFAAGTLMVILLRRPGVHLFNPADPKPGTLTAAAPTLTDGPAV